MRKIYTFLLILTAFQVYAQQPLHNIRRGSHQVMFFRISADSTEKFLKNGFKDIDQFMVQTPVLICPAEKISENELPLGNYIKLSIQDTMIHLEYLSKTNLDPYLVNNDIQPQLVVKTKDGNIATHAQVWVDGTPAQLNEQANTFRMDKKHPDGLYVRVALPGDTTFMVIDDENNYGQGHRSFKNTFSNFSIRNFLRSFKYKFHKKTTYQKNGYVIFNKPKYYSSDTVRLKAYVMNSKGKPLNEELELKLDYNNKGNHISKRLAFLKPVSPGAYVFSFATGDTLPNDVNYRVNFLSTKKTHPINYVTATFKIEDYLLKEIASFNFSTDHDNFYKGDTFNIKASAKDANGLALMDGRLELFLTVDEVTDIFQNIVHVSDTLWQGQKILAIEGDTKFEIPSNQFPDANLQMTATAIFRNSNNEVHTEQKKINLKNVREGIEVEFENGQIRAILYRNGKSVESTGTMENDYADGILDIRFPYVGKVDPMAESYWFTAYDKKDTISSKMFDLPSNYNLDFNNIQKRDTVVAMLSNPYHIPVFYSIFFKDKEIYSSSSAEEEIIWKGFVPDNKMYQFRWQYYWNGEHISKTEKLVTLAKIADAKIGGLDVVFPGQKDSIRIEVTDYQGKSLKNMNLTAVSYNSTFGKDIRIVDPPYIQKFKTKNRRFKNIIEVEWAEKYQNYSYGKHREFEQLFHTDTMPYYKFLFPESIYHIEKSKIAALNPQISVNAVLNGVPQEIYLLYIDNELVYYNGINVNPAYSFSTYPGYKKIGMRLKDQLVTVDSIYVQPYYKHDISFDLNKSAPNYISTKMPSYWTEYEKSMLDEKIMRIENNIEIKSGYVWQGDKSYYLDRYGDYVVGPFSKAHSVQYFKPNNFDIDFNFESGYVYTISPKMVRLEKKPIFPANVKVELPNVKTTLHLGDTLMPLPIIQYQQPVPEKEFLFDQRQEQHSSNPNVQVNLFLPKDSIFSHVVVKNEIDGGYEVLKGAYIRNSLFIVHPGVYTFVMVSNHEVFQTIQHVSIDRLGMYCLDFRKLIFQNTSALIDSIRNYQLAERKSYSESAKKEAKRILDEFKKTQMPLPLGSSIVSGVVIDSKGLSPIQGVTLKLKGYNYGVLSSSSGFYSLKNIPSGKYLIQVSMLGYESQELEVMLSDHQEIVLDVKLVAHTEVLSEVVVMGLGASTRSFSSTASSVSITSELTSRLEGKVAGVSLSAQPIDNRQIMIRGLNALETNVLYIVDGVITDKLPAKIEIADLSTLKGSEATALYGERASNGVILVTTKKNNGGVIRKDFKDYAFWEPNLITDENGVVSFEVKYPDNITSWKNYVVGMDSKHHILKSFKLVKSFKTVLAQLSTPQFLIEGDTAFAIGKKINYTSAPVTIQSKISVNQKQLTTLNEQIKSSDAIISSVQLLPHNTDTLSVRLEIKTDNGLYDGEERKIPVLRKGLYETIGEFSMISSGDSSLQTVFSTNAGIVKLYAMNNTLDLLIDELVHIKSYPYACMEQTASKIIAYAMDKKIKTQLNQKFVGEKEMQSLIKKIQLNQQFDGGWGWWSGNSSNLTITNYVTRSLLQIRGDQLLETNIRNALIYLSNKLPLLRKGNMLETLFTLSEAGHDMDYSSYLRVLKFDSLTLHQQWQMLAIAQKQHLDFDIYLKKLLLKKTSTALGGAYWGELNYSWDRNHIATSVLAYNTLSRISGHLQEQNQLTQFFLNQRKSGYWNNTVESATIVSTILADVLRANKDFTKGAELRLSGDTNLVIRDFPYQVKFTPKNMQLSMHKTGGGIVYVSTTQNVFKDSPVANDSIFGIKTYFKNNANIRLASLKAGEKVMLKVDIDAKVDAEYVQIEIPIPAGCTYHSKDNYQFDEHWEYFKDRVMIFTQAIKKGVHTFEIELEPRYTGSYTINPAKVELMYFPSVYGNNTSSKIRIDN